MNIACNNCDKSYNLPDERLPQGRVVNFPCPVCKSKIILDLRSSEKRQGPSARDKQVFKPLAETSESALDGTDLKKKILQSVKDLPPMPKVLFKAREVMADPKSSFKDVAAIIETDQAIAARVLKVANSAYYGLSGMVNSIHQATVVLGQQTLEQVITMVASSSLLGKRLKGYNLNAGVLWKHSLAVALGSRMIAAKRAPALESDAFSVGLIHDAGKLALNEYLAQKKQDVRRFFQEHSPSYLLAEQHILGFDHTEIAENLCLKWKLPESHAKAMRYHHTPSSSENNQLAHVIYLANHLAKDSGYGSSQDAESEPLEESSLKILTLKQADIEELSGSLTTAVEEITESLMS
jgi:HD-like signal output (HDOD) protein/DNA-directed RNA polymerase subunit RPC12/RpoP